MLIFLPKIADTLEVDKSELIEKDVAKRIGAELYAESVVNT